MKISSLLSASAIAASTLLTFSTATLAISQTQDISANSQLQSLQISDISIQTNDDVSTKAEKKGKDEDEEPTAGRCNPSHPLFPFCGWW